MNWIKNHLEQAFLMLLLFGLSAVSIVLALTYSVEVGEAGQSKGGAAKIEQDFARYGSLATKLAARTEWKAPAEGHRLFIARKLEWRPEEKKLKLYNPFDPGPDGLTPAWKEQYGFDLADPKQGGVPSANRPHRQGLPSSVHHEIAIERVQASAICSHIQELYREWRTDIFLYTNRTH